MPVLRKAPNVVCHYMRTRIAIFILTFINSSILGQSSDSSLLPLTSRITVENPLIIDYKYGTCWGDNTFKIIIDKVVNQDSLNVTIKEYLPVAFTIYAKNKTGDTIIIKDNKKIKNPYKPKFPRDRPGRYYDTKHEYLIDTSFVVSQTKLTKYLVDFEHTADNNKLDLIGTNSSGRFCFIRLINGRYYKQYSLDAWYKIDDHLKKGE